MEDVEAEVEPVGEEGEGGEVGEEVGDVREVGEAVERGELVSSPSSAAGSEVEVEGEEGGRGRGETLN